MSAQRKCQKNKIPQNDGIANMSKVLECQTCKMTKRQHLEHIKYAKIPKNVNAPKWESTEHDKMQTNLK